MVTDVQQFAPDEEVAGIRDSIDHPIIDGDGHYVEFMPLVIDFLREIAGPTALDRIAATQEQFRQFIPHGANRGVVTPTDLHATGDSLDRMTSQLPDLLYDRLDQLGLDFALVYPTWSLPALMHPDDELRPALARAFNTYGAELHFQHRDRIEPVASIPSFTPNEALEELEYAVGVLGYKAIVMDGVVFRSERPDGTPMEWVDTLGHYSMHDYDPFWARCEELRVVPAFHGLGLGWGSRTSMTNYVYNHLGALAANQEAVCRAIVMGGVAKRFPGLRFTFLEGGVCWAAQLESDLVHHFEKRNRQAMQLYDPQQIDVDLCLNLFGRYSSGPLKSSFDQFEQALRGMVASERSALWESDDFEEGQIGSVEDIVDVFSRQLFFGCEGDDPLTSIGCSEALLPKRVPLNIVFGSDISHWDVPDMRRVLPEAWEPVEKGLMSLEQFAEFACGNEVRMLTDANPDFFVDTAVADAVRPFQTMEGSRGAGRS
jgi:predicted TIM-barrel fold metal-dependent hydrolase